MTNFKINLQLFAAEQNVVTSAQMAKAREVDFVERFTGDVLKKLMEALGVVRKIPMMEGTAMYVYKTTGTLQPGTVTEGEIIPLSQYERTSAGRRRDHPEEVAQGHHRRGHQEVRLRRGRARDRREDALRHPEEHPQGLLHLPPEGPEGHEGTPVEVGPARPCRRCWRRAGASCRCCLRTTPCRPCTSSTR